MLPLITRLLQPEITRKVDIECREKREKNMEKHGPKTTPLGQLDPGAKVWLQPVKSTESQWVPGRVLRKRSEPRSYDVQTESGAVHRRNRRHLHSADWELEPTADGRHADNSARYGYDDEDDSDEDLCEQHNRQSQREPVPAAINTCEQREVAISLQRFGNGQWTKVVHF